MITRTERMRAPDVADPASRVAGGALTSALALLGALLLTVFLAVRYRNWGYDDPYITYRYAHNLSSGAGFVYDHATRALSTTAPLFAVLLAIFDGFGVAVPPLATVIGFLSIGVSCWCFWRLGELWQQPVVGLVAALALPASTLLLITVGSETPVTVAVVLVATVCVASRRFTPAAVLIAIGTFVRGDVLIAAVPLGCLALVHRPRPSKGELVRAAVPALLILAAGFGGTWLYFGRPLPDTLMAKRSQARIQGARTFAPRLVDEARSLWQLGIMRPALLLAVVGLAWGVVRRSRWMSIPLWAAVYAVAYSATGVSAYIWYYGPLVPGLVVAMGLGVDAFAVGAARLAPTAGPRVGLGVALLVVLLPLTAQVREVDHRRDDRLNIYDDVGRWLAANTAPDASVGALEVGIVGYRSNRTMIDFAGLIQPDVADAIVAGGSYEEPALYAFTRYQPDWVVLVGSQLPKLRAVAVSAGCSVARSFTTIDHPLPVDVLQCNWQAPVAAR